MAINRSIEVKSEILQYINIDLLPDLFNKVVVKFEPLVIHMVPRHAQIS